MLPVLQLTADGKEHSLVELSPTPFRRNAFDAIGLEKRFKRYSDEVHELGSLELRLPSESKRLNRVRSWCRGYHRTRQQLWERIIKISEV